MIEIIFLIARLGLDLHHVALVHAPSTKLEEITTQQRLREEVRHVIFSAYEFDTNLTALDVITMFEESNVEMLVLARRFRIVRREDAAQIVAVDGRRRNEYCVRLVVGSYLFTLGHHIESGNGWNNKATFEQQ